MDAISSLKLQLSQPQCHIKSYELMNCLLEMAEAENLNTLFKSLVSDFINNFPSDGKQARVANEDLILYDSREWLMVFKPKRHSKLLDSSEIIYAPSNPFVYVNCGETEVQLPAYQLDSIESKTLLKPLNAIQIQPKTAFVFDKPCQAVDVFPGGMVNAIYLYDLANPSKLRAAFSLKTYQAVFSIVGDPHDSRTKALLLWLGEVGSCEPDVIIVESIISFVSHSSHFIRWAAIQALANIDFGKAKTYILAAQLDPHPEIAKVARRIVTREGL